MEQGAGFEVRPLSPSIGAEIHGLDLGKPLDEATFAALRRTFVERKVIFFRDQALSPGEHVAFCRRFGKLEIHPFTPKREEYPEVMLIRHGPDRRGTENTWHSDVTWRKEPSLGSALRAVEVPPVGGDTLFANMEPAYEALSSHMKRMLGGSSPSTTSPRSSSAASRPGAGGDAASSTRRRSIRSCARTRSPAGRAST